MKFRNPFQNLPQILCQLVTVLLASFAWIAPVLAQGAPDAADAQDAQPAKAVLVTRQKLVVTSGAHKTVCGYQADDSSKKQICLPALKITPPAHALLNSTYGQNIQCSWAGSEVSCSQTFYAFYIDHLLKVPTFNHVLSLNVPDSYETSDACAIDQAADGSTRAVCWGPSAEMTSVPTTLKNPTVLKVASRQACADSADGFIQCWGDSNPGSSPSPVRHLRKIEIGTDAACAVDDYGMMCWGPATGDAQSLAVPDQLKGDGIVIDVAIRQSVACALTFDHQVVCWGATRTTPPDLNKPIAISAIGPTTFCATDSDGVKCWGSYELDGTENDLP